MNYSETVHLFSVGENKLLGIAAIPDAPNKCGIIITVGGPQYRVGSHRQFLLLSRRLASEGYSVFRFDYRGMGDSSGTKRSFDEVSEDISAAIGAFQTICPQVRRIVLWGLCDAASANLIYVQTTRDARVNGIVLLNPWVRSEAGLAKTHIKHYYGQRLLQREFWLKLFSGKMRLLGSAREFLSQTMKARENVRGSSGQTLSFQERMAEGMKIFEGNILLILSGQDFTAKEFLDHADGNRIWAEALRSERVKKINIPEADHTFSSAVLRSRVEENTIHWLENR